MRVFSITSLGLVRLGQTWSGQTSRLACSSYTETGTVIVLHNSPWILFIRMEVHFRVHLLKKWTLLYISSFIRIVSNAQIELVLLHLWLEGYDGWPKWFFFFACISWRFKILWSDILFLKDKPLFSSVCYVVGIGDSLK